MSLPRRYPKAILTIGRALGGSISERGPLASSTASTTAAMIATIGFDSRIDAFDWSHV